MNCAKITRINQRHIAFNGVSQTMNDDALEFPRPVVLIASADEWFARSVESLLAARSISVVMSATARKALEYARSIRPDAIFIESRLPDMQGIELCRMLRADTAVTADTPIIIATVGPALRKDRIEALRAGAWEYCDLLPDADELLLRLATYMRAKITTDRIREASLQDTVTGLYNLRGLTRRLDEVGGEAIRHRRPLACLAISVDFASPVNSSRVNSQVVAEQVARVVTKACRASDAIARLPSNEFVVLAPDTGPGGAQRLAERVVVATESGGAATKSDVRTLRMNVRVGFCAVAEFTDVTIRPADVLSRATAALQRSRDPQLDRQIVGFVIPGP
jgi:diguanylate cyclase (GGDEF)-like protein